MSHDIYPDWFNNLSPLDEPSRSNILESTLKSLDTRCEAANKFVKNFKCELVGFCPRIELLEDEPKEFVFENERLLYWCKQGKFGLITGCDRNDFLSGHTPKPNEIDESVPWYEQLQKIDDSKFKEIEDKFFNLLKKHKRETLAFIVQYKPEILGFIPRIEYTMVKDDQNDINTVWVHPFSLPTMCFWSKQGKFVFFVNANLDHNESVLSSVPGNNVQPLRGFTG